MHSFASILATLGATLGCSGVAPVTAGALGGVGARVAVSGALAAALVGSVLLLAVARVRTRAARQRPAEDDR